MGRRTHVQLLSDVRLDGVEPQPGWRDAGKGEHVLGHHTLGLTEHWIAERHIDPEGLTVEPAGQLALGAEAEPVVLELGVVVVGPDLERHEVGEVAAPRLLQLRKHLTRRTHQPEVDVPGGAGPFEAQLEDEPTLEGCRIPEHRDDASEEALEDEELPLAREAGAAPGRSPKALLQRLLEGGGRSVGPPRHATRPPKGSSAVSTSPSSCLVTSPRRRACRAACCKSSGETPAFAQSLSERRGLVMGTEPIQERSAGGTSA